jgi:hypothetical protein
VDLDDNGPEFAAARDDADEGGGADPGDDDSCECSGGGEEQRLCERLTDEAAPAGPESDADGHLAAAGGRPGEEHAGEVEAGEEQEEAGDRHEREEGFAVAVARRREAGPGGFDFDAQLAHARIFGSSSTLLDGEAVEHGHFGAGLGQGRAGLEACNEGEGGRAGDRAANP